MYNSLIHQRAQARAALLEKVNGRNAPETPARDTTLQADTEQLYQELIAHMGWLELGRWLVMEYPWLEKPTTPLLRVWWILQRKHDEIMGIDHRGLFVLHPAALLTPAPGGGEGTR